jgi:hypothetical protein
VWLRAAAATLALCTGASVAQEAQPLRPDVAQPLAAAQQLLARSQAREALLKLQEAERAAPPLSTYERFVLERLRGAAAQLLGEPPATLAALEQVQASPHFSTQLPADQQLAVLHQLAIAALRSGQSPAVQRWPQAYAAAGGRDAPVRMAWARAQLAAGDAGAARAQLLQLVTADEASRTVPREDVLNLLGRAQLGSQDETGYRATLERLVAHHPKPAYWADLVARVQGSDDFADRLTLDAWRLLRRAAGLTGREQVLEMARLATRAGLPGEALAVLDDGFARGWLGTGADAGEHRRQRERLQETVQADLSQRATAEAAARADPDGAALLAQGQALIGHGLVEPGLALMREGLQRGPRAHPHHARLRLGVALLQAGHRAEAEPLLQSIKSRDGSAELARLWLLVR